jgi:hypothetical protein
MDYGTRAKGENPLTLNEHRLAQGRALHRPQNKKSDKHAYDDAATVCRPWFALFRPAASLFPRSSHAVIFLCCHLLRLTSSHTVIVCLPFQTFIEERKPFVDFLKHCKLSPKLRALVLYAVALINTNQEKDGAEQDGVEADGSSVVATEAGLDAVCLYISSLGRYGGTSFLVPMYGVSELPQAFCRLAAVYGGIYTLRTGITDLVLADSVESEGGEAKKGKGKQQRVRGVVVSNGQFLQCDTLVADPVYLPDYVASTSSSGDGGGDSSASTVVHRLVVVTDRSLVPAVGRFLLVVPPMASSSIGNKAAIHVAQADESACAAPRGKFVIQLSTVGPHTPANKATADSAPPEHDVLRRALAFLFDTYFEQYTPQESRDMGGGQRAAGSGREPLPECVNWHIEFTQHAPHVGSSAHGQAGAANILKPLPDNVILATDIVDPRQPMKLHFDSAVRTAERIFTELCPGAQFLPRTISAVNADEEEEAAERAALQSATEQAEEAELAAAADTAVAEDAAQDAAAPPPVPPPPSE